MSYLTFAEIIKRKPGPYPGATKGMVAVVNPPIKYSSQGEEKQSMTVGLCDESVVVKAIIYDQAQFPRFKQGSTISLRNFIIRDRTRTVITKTTTSFNVRHLAVPEEKMKEAQQLVNPPPAPIIPIKDALTSPLKSVVSISGQIVQEDQEREVMVGSTPIKVKNIYIKDSSAEKVRVSLWRESCTMEHRPGDYVSISDVITTPFRGEVHFSLTARSKIMATEPPVLNRTVDIERIGGDNQNFELLSVDGDSFTIDGELLRLAIPVDEDIESFILGRAPVTITLTLRGEKVTAAELS